MQIIAKETVTTSYSIEPCCERARDNLSLLTVMGGRVYLRAYGQGRGEALNALEFLPVSYCPWCGTKLEEEETWMEK